jgi:hypothetical protein
MSSRKKRSKNRSKKKRSCGDADIRKVLHQGNMHFHSSLLLYKRKKEVTVKLDRTGVREEE